MQALYISKNLLFNLSFSGLLKVNQHRTGSGADDGEDHEHVKYFAHDLLASERFGTYAVQQGGKQVATMMAKGTPSG